MDNKKIRKYLIKKNWNCEVYPALNFFTGKYSQNSIDYELLSCQDQIKNFQILLK